MKTHISLSIPAIRSDIPDLDGNLPARFGRPWSKNLKLSLVAMALILVAAPSAEAKRSAADQALYERARKACNDFRKYPDGARPIINYKGGWFRCQEPKFRRD